MNKTDTDIPQRIKMGVIGTGHMGQYHVNVLAGLKETHELVGIYDASEERLKELSEKYNTTGYDSAEALIADVDAVTIAVPTALHYDIAKAALSAGVHVLVEKPITETTEQAKELITLAREKNLILQVGHVERFNGAVMELNKIVTKPLLIEAKRLSPFTPRIKDVGVVLDILIHDLDIVLNMVNSNIKSYSATGSKVMSDNEDIAILQIAFEDGAVANLTASRVSQHKVRELTITQEKSFVSLNYANQDIEIYRQASAAYLMTKEEIKYSQESFVEKLYVHKDNPLKSEHMHFYECITGKAQPLVSNEKDLETLEIALGSLQQIRSKF